MRPFPAVLAAVALAASMLAFAPAVDSQQEPVTDYAVTFDGDGAATLEGAPEAAGTNLGELATGCSKDPDTYCDTVLVTVHQPVADTTPGTIDVGTGTATFTLAPAVPGADFDIRVLETNADGSDRGQEVASSGNFPGCSTVCETPASTLTGPGCGAEHDECGEWGVTTTDVGGTRHYRVEVVYYLAGGGYTLDLTYERTDGAGDATATGGAEGGEDADGTPVTTDASAAAASAERLDVTGGYEKVGDWGGGGNNAAVGDALGQDFEAAFIEYADDTFTFTLDMTSLLPVGGTPELTRYGWSFRYNDLELELDGKFTNYSRGACDPTAGSCPPPRDPGIGSFLLRGDCVEDTSLPMTLTLCQEFANVQATFDPADGTITIPIPADALAPEGVGACDEIVGIPSFIGNSIWSAPSAFITNTAMPYDDAVHYVPFVVPPADPAATC